MRITDLQLKIIEEAFLKHFNPSDHLWLFGSRVDDNKKGGDFDFYIEAEEDSVDIAFKNRVAFVNALWRAMGMQKIDIVLNLVPHKANLPIYQHAKTTGIQLI
jgi:predicted nucleotidyltransferase